MMFGCCFQGPVHISIYGRYGYAEWKKAIKYGKKFRKNRGWWPLLVMMFGCCFQGPVHISIYGRCGYAKWKKAIKYGKKSEKNRGWCLLLLVVIMGWHWFRVQCAFPYMEGVAMLNEKKAIKYGKNQKKIGGGLGMMFRGVLCSGSSVHFQIWKKELF